MDIFVTILEQNDRFTTLMLVLCNHVPSSCVCLQKLLNLQSNQPKLEIKDMLKRISRRCMWLRGSQPCNYSLQKKKKVKETAASVEKQVTSQISSLFRMAFNIWLCRTRQPDSKNGQNSCVGLLLDPEQRPHVSHQSTAHWTQQKGLLQWRLADPLRLCLFQEDPLGCDRQPDCPEPIR